MQVNYCDLCGQPIKDRDFFLFYIVTATKASVHIESLEDYTDSLNRITKEVKEVCPNCKHVIDRIFELRFDNIHKLETDILGWFNKPAKDPKKKEKE